MDQENSQSTSRKPGTSPIRPQNPEPPRPKVAPSLARPTRPQPPTSEHPATGEDEQIARAEEALERLREKMAEVAAEYAEGKLNQAQFNAIYRRYTEQRDITQRLLERNPQSDAWQSVVKAGHTSFLRDHFTAKIISFGIYHLEDGGQISLTGGVRLPHDQLMPIFARIKAAVVGGHHLAPAWRPLKDGSWVVIVPGQLTVAVVIYSLEPAGVQRKMVADAHDDFERANEKLLRRGDFTPEGLVFPHRALMG